MLESSTNLQSRSYVVCEKGPSTTRNTTKTISKVHLVVLKLHCLVQLLVVKLMNNPSHALVIYMGGSMKLYDHISHLLARQVCVIPYHCHPSSLKTRTVQDCMHKCTHSLCAHPAHPAAPLCSATIFNRRPLFPRRHPQIPSS